MSTSQAGAQGGFAGRLDPAAWSPPLSDVAELLAKATAGCVKLPPGVDPDAVESLLDAVEPDLPRRFTWTEAGGELRELCLWTGALAPASEPRRMAVRLLGGPLAKLGSHPEARTLSGKAGGEPDEPALDPQATCGNEVQVRWLVEPRPSVIRAGLIGALARDLAMAPIDPYMAYLGKTDGSEPPLHDLARTYRVLDGAPLDKKQVKRMLRAHDIGRLTVKKRGHKSSADELAKRFAGPGKSLGTLMIAKVGRSHRAFLVEPVTENV